LRIRFPVFPVLASLLITASILGQTPYSIAPNSAPASGGTNVTIKGDFGAWPYEVFFGNTRATATTRVDEHTLTAVTPAHFPGPSILRIFEYDRFLDTGVMFFFTGDLQEEYEIMLVPMLTPPVRGGFGSEFHTKLVMASTDSEKSVPVYGLTEVCTSPCVPPPVGDSPLVATETQTEIALNGTPGRWIYVPRDRAHLLAANLRVYDVSRTDLNYGVEIPIVRERDIRYGKLVLLNIPTDPRFRNTLRIYGAPDSEITLTIEGQAPRTFNLENGGDYFTPAYAQFSDFPTSGGPLRVTIDAVGYLQGPSPPVPLADAVWAFVTVTNNDTQMISTVTPQP
jgi:IPT/TIG domain